MNKPQGCTPPKPTFPAPAMHNPAAEADCALVADVWRRYGENRAVVSFFMVQWLSDAVQWESAAMASRIQALFHT